MTDNGPPAWLVRLVDAITAAPAEVFSKFLPPASGGRLCAVLLLFGESAAGPDILLIERAASMRRHAGQPAFPGGAVDSTDEGHVATALREAREEVGVDPAGVDVVAVLPPLWLPPSGYIVTPVLAWWRQPGEVWAVDPAEVAAVLRVPLRHLADPANRRRVGLSAGLSGPAFDVAGLTVWGFTGGLLDRVLHFGGLERPWDDTMLHERPVQGSGGPPTPDRGVA